VLLNDSRKMMFAVFFAFWRFMEIITLVRLTQFASLANQRQNETGNRS
jgi:hypothetical protein